MTFNRGSLTRWTGLLAGCLAGVTLLAAGRMPEGRAAAGVRLQLSATPATELGVTPAGAPFLTARSLSPGSRPATGTLELANYTGRALTVRLPLSGAARDLDGLVRVSVTAADREVFAGRLGDLREPGRLTVELPPRGTLGLDVRATLEPAARRDYQGRSADLALAPVVAGRRR